MPQLGAKISLISKAHIRYEGSLYAVDPQECTISLSTVRSFGTEDRATQIQIAPQTEVYDYILFRGCDIKDIRVIKNNMPHPHDPAILQAKLPNGQQIIPHTPRGNPNHMGPGAYGNSLDALDESGIDDLGDGYPSLPTPGMVKNPLKLMSPSKVPTDAARSETPGSVNSGMSSSTDTGVQVKKIYQRPPQYAHQNVSNQHQRLNRNNSGLGGNESDDGRRPQQQRGSYNNQQQRHGNYDNYYEQRGRRDSGRTILDNSYNNQFHDVRRHYSNQRSQPGGQNWGWTMQRGLSNPNSMFRYRGGGNGAGIGGGRGRIQNQGYWSSGVPTGGYQMKSRNSLNTIMFQQDFDFEQGNHKFAELRSQMSKLKVGEEDKPDHRSPPEVNGVAEKKDDSGNDSGTGEHEPEAEEEEIAVGYNKKKSFFDNISCEAGHDRSKNKWSNWRRERNLNNETFGVSSVGHGNFFSNHSSSFYNRNTSNYYGSNNGYHRHYHGDYNHRYRIYNYRTGGGPRDNGYFNGNDNATDDADATGDDNAEGTNSNDKGNLSIAASETQQQDTMSQNAAVVDGGQ